MRLWVLVVKLVAVLGVKVGIKSNVMIPCPRQ